MKEFSVGQDISWVDGMGVERKGIITEVRLSDGDVVVKDIKTECKIRLKMSVVSPPPVVGDLRERIAQIIYGKAIPKEVDWEDCDSYSEWQRKIRFTYTQADSILNIIKEAGYVKLRKGEYISGVGTINIKEPFCGIADGDEED